MAVRAGRQEEAAIFKGRAHWLREESGVSLMVSTAAARDDGVMTDTGNDDRGDARAADGSAVDRDATPPRDGGPGTPAARASGTDPAGDGQDGDAARRSGAPREGSAEDTSRTGTDPHGPAREDPPRTGDAPEADAAATGPMWTGRVLARDSEGRILFGVCAGLGRFTGIDPVLFRVGFGVLVLGSGIGFFLYLAAFLLMRGVHGEPGHVEQWTRRSFDAETVMALLCGVFAVGLVLNVASGGIGPGTVVVGTLLAIALLAAHTSGVDVFGLIRSLPERLGRRAGPTGVPPYGMPEKRPPATVLGDPATGPDAAATPSPGPEPSARPVPPTVVTAHASPGITGAYPAPAEHDTRGSDPGDARRFPRRPAEGGYDSSGAPFAPHGPYAPAACGPPVPPRGTNRPWPYGYGAPVTVPPAPPPTRRRPPYPRTFIGPISMLLALIVGGIVMAAQSRTGIEQPQVIGGAMLLTMGIGLTVTTWFGRAPGLIVVGTLVALVVSLLPVFDNAPGRIGGKIWRPTTVADVSHPYRVGVGEGLLDLSVLELPEGSRVPVNAWVSVGDLEVVLPPHVRAEVDLLSRVGDIEVDDVLVTGPRATVRRVLEPEVPPKGRVATIVLTVRANVGDVEVRRAL